MRYSYDYRVAVVEANHLPGGLSDKGPPPGVDPKQVAKGIKVEMEHTNDPAIAREISYDHLREDPKYYDKLEKIEKHSYDRRAAEKDAPGAPEALDGKYQLVVDIYEKATKEAYPVVRHIFVGKTKDEAQGYFGSHMKTDEFMRDCVKKGKWEQVECRSVSHWIEPKGSRAE